MLEASNRDTADVVREPRPFLYLKPARLPLKQQAIDKIGQHELDESLTPSISHVVRCLVDYTIARQNQNAVWAQPIQMSVLNRRRRAARSWLLAIAAGRVDGATRHAVATQWLPLLCGTGPDLQLATRPGRELIEFVRGAVTAVLFDTTHENLLPKARALHLLESTLAVHLTAVFEHASYSNNKLSKSAR